MANGNGDSGKLQLRETFSKSDKFAGCKARKVPHNATPLSKQTTEKHVPMTDEQFDRAEQWWDETSSFDERQDVCHRAGVDQGRSEKRFDRLDQDDQHKLLDHLEREHLITR